MTNSTKKNKKSPDELKIGLNQICIFFIHFIAILSFFPGCASIQQPTGGPKDSIPPKVISETPPNLTRNFSTREVTIEFDEYVKLNNEFQEFSISPDVDVPPEYKIRKKTLIITLPDTLAENTTYSINFGEGLVDFNESNPLVNYRYVFSTGDEIDSLSVSGNVINAISLEPETDINVLLIPISQDSIFGKKKANIFTKTDSSGNFILQNLSETAYRIYALKEEAADRIYNNPGEEIGFLGDSIYLDRNISGIKLKTFKEIPENFRILDRKIENSGRLLFVFNKSLQDPTINILDNDNLNTNKIVEFTNLRDSAYVWLPQLEFDTINVQINDNNQALDTVTLRRNKNDEYDRSITITDNLSNQRVDQVRNIVFTGSAPIQSADLSKIKLIEDTTVRTNFQLSLDKENSRRAYLRYRWRPKRTYVLELQEGAFIGQFGELSKDGQRKFTYDDSGNYGDIVLDIQLPDSNSYIIEVIKEDKSQVIQAHVIDRSQKITYKQLPGQNYTVRVVYDENKNRKWDTGNLKTKTQPEQLWYWDKVITVRPNWEQEEIVNVPSIETVRNLVPETRPDTVETEDNSTNPLDEPYIKSGTLVPATNTKTETTEEEKPNVEEGKKP
ncbi:Ig-like domain-containing protein [Albibacterium indicum]|uniref:Ig-like domain-containing protein n=1 Tax=Albibacterium indicum TaxID=2292082 RepID=UPI000E4AEF34|nr:Ig-like domain-containing protein [Pedobacter indicus]